MRRSEIAKIIDHTALKPDIIPQQVIQLCYEAREYGLGAVCIAPCWAHLAADLLRGSSVRLAAVIGFPHGNTLSSVKAFEATSALDAGANELDMVINVGLLKAGDHTGVLADIMAVVRAINSTPHIVVKVILETALLTDSEKILACQLSCEAGAHFVKTSTGFGPAGANVHDVRLMRETVGNQLGVKAAGGIRDLKTLVEMVAAGANRIGCSSSIAILKEIDGD